MTDILELLWNTPTASGAEHGVVTRLAEALADCTDSCSVDAVGNLIAVKRAAAAENAKKIALFCAIDAPGLIVTFLEDTGLARVAPLGKFDFRSACFCEVTDGTHIGILIPDSDKSDSSVTAHVDFGFADADAASQHLHPGDVLCFCPAALSLQNEKRYAAGLGNKLCAAALAQTARTVERLREYELDFVFCAQTALGNRGAYQAAFAVKPDLAIGLEPYEAQTPGILMLDRSLVCDPTLTRALQDTASQSGTELTPFVGADTVSDASRVQCAGNGCATGVLLMPIQQKGTVREGADLSHARTFVNLTVRFLRSR